MDNQQRIIQAAIENNVLTEMQVVEMMDNGDDIPLHTLNGWNYIGKSKGIRYKIRKGEHGIECKLWKKRRCKSSEMKSEFYLARSFLFQKSQIEEYRDK